MAKKASKERDPYLIAVGQRIRAVRKSKGLTMEQAAEAAETSIQFLSQVEKGEQSMTIKKFSKLAAALGVSSDYLLYGRAPYNENVSLAAELLGQMSPADLEVMVRVVGDLWRLLNEIRPDIQR